MKRTAIFALAAAGALGVTAVVGGVGYASALDVAEQAGTTLDVKGVSTVGAGSAELRGSATPTPTPSPSDDSTTAGDDDGTADQGSGDAVDTVNPSDPTVITHKRGKDCTSDDSDVHAEHRPGGDDSSDQQRGSRGSDDAAGSDDSGKNRGGDDSRGGGDDRGGRNGGGGRH
ncbi:MAG: hypothetical protein DI534_08070 [Leifsonia xyli]|nr:MAG: hypothetical protein DI534_08070 [Leifsonia xyli]